MIGHMINLVSYWLNACTMYLLRAPLPIIDDNGKVAKMFVIKIKPR